MAAKLEGELGYLRRDLRMEQAKFRQRNIEDFKNKYSLDDAMVMDEDVSGLMDGIVVTEAKLELVKALALGYEGLRNAASREMYRRGTEAAARD